MRKTGNGPLPRWDDQLHAQGSAVVRTELQAHIPDGQLPVGLGSRDHTAKVVRLGRHLSKNPLLKLRANLPALLLPLFGSLDAFERVNEERRGRHGIEIRRELASALEPVFPRLVVGVDPSIDFNLATGKNLEEHLECLAPFVHCVHGSRRGLGMGVDVRRECRGAGRQRGSLGDESSTCDFFHIFSIFSKLESWVLCDAIQDFHFGILSHCIIQLCVVKKTPHEKRTRKRALLASLCPPLSTHLERVRRRDSQRSGGILTSRGFNPLGWLAGKPDRE